MLSGCSKTTEDVITISAAKSPAIYSAIAYAEEHPEVEVTTWDTFDTLLAHIQTDQATLFALPLNVGATLYNKDIPLQLIQVNNWGSMFLVSTVETPLSALEQQTIYVPSQGGPPDLLFNFIMQQQHIKNVSTTFVNMNDIAQQIANGTIQHAIIPEPMLSTLQANLKQPLSITIDFNNFWQTQFGTDLPQTGIFAKKDWLNNHSKFVANYQQQQVDIIKNISTHNTIQSISTYLDLSPTIIKNSLQNSILVSDAPLTMREEVENYLSILAAHNPESIGGALPSQDFYYES